MTALAQYDLTSTLSAFLDPHLIIELLEFLRQNERNIYAKEDVIQSELQVAQKTKRYDLIRELQTTTKNVVVVDVEKEQKKCEDRLQTLQVKLKGILEFLSTKDIIKEIKNAINVQPSQDSTTGATSTKKISALDYLQFQHADEIDIDEDVVDELYEFARLEFENGRYEAAAEHLLYYRLLVTEAEKEYTAQWGRVCALIMNKTEWDKCRTDVLELREMIESSAVRDTTFIENPLLVLQHRSWFIHWVLFIFFRPGSDKPETASEKSALVDLCFHDRYLNAIQTNCPHVLRYFAVAMVIASKRRRNQHKELIRMLEQEQIAYSDPITKLLESLYVKADFDAAQHWLRVVEDNVLPNDYFLRECKQDFMNNARLTIFQLYCRIHRVVQISSIAERLNLDPASAEKWVINAIRNNRYSAKIDAESKSVILQEQQHNIYQQILEETEALVDRTNLLSSNVESKLQ